MDVSDDVTGAVIAAPDAADDKYACDCNDEDDDEDDDDDDDDDGGDEGSGGGRGTGDAAPVISARTLMSRSP